MNELAGKKSGGGGGGGLVLLTTPPLSTKGFWDDDVTVHSLL
jgi:hypothetical protein